MIRILQNNLLKLILLCPIILFAQSIDLTPDASFLGTHHAERIGYALGGGGDVNGDGLADFLIGTFHHQTFGQDAGAAYLVLGQSPYGRKMYDSLAWCGLRFLGESKFQALGFSVANNGDLTGDGFDDLLIGAPGGNPKLRAPGKVYLIYGKPTPDWGYHSLPVNSANGAISGEVNWDRFGMSVAYVGDVNADGLDDFVVSAPDNDQGNSGAGKVYFFLGRNTNWPLDALAGQEARATFICERPDANLGFSVAGVGDVNADGIPDFVIGAPGINKAFLIYGRRDTGWKTNFDLEDNADVIFSGENYNGDMNGYCVAAAGDVNGDQISDILISAIHFRANGQLAGKVYVVFGRQNGWSDPNFNLLNADASFKGELPGDMAGWSVSGAGDVDGDGYAEIVIGMFNEENKKNVPGKAWVVAGKPDYWPRNTELSSLPAFIGEKNYQLCGFCVGHAGDVDGDRWSDFLVAAPYFSSDSSGNVYLFRAKRPQAKISGAMNYFQTNLAVPDVPLQLTGDFEDSTVSDATGAWQLSVFQLADYQIEISRIPPAPACLSAYDAALTARAALQLENFTDDQKMAGDVDANGQISVFDATQILRESLGLPDIHLNFAGEWRALPNQLQFSDVRTDFPGQNMTLLVLGDVDASWKPNQALARVDAREQSRPVNPGEEIVVPIEFPAGKSVLAFDGKFLFQPTDLEFIQIQKTEFSQQFSLSHAETNPGEVRFGAFTVEPRQKSGTYATVHFRIKTGAAAKTELRLVSQRMNQETLPELRLSLVNESQTSLEYSFRLLPNYPNPFNSGTRIGYQLAQKSFVDLSIYNALGQKICILTHNLQDPGEYRVNWDGTTDNGLPAPSGIYLIKLQAGNFQQTRKITLLR